MLNNLMNNLYRTFVQADRYLYFLEGLVNTMILTCCSFVLSTLIALLLCAMSRSKVRALSLPAKGFILLTEQMPATVMLLVMVYVVFNEATLPLLVVSIIALSCKMTGYIADVFNSALGAVNPAEVEAARSLGLSKFQAFRYVVLPQAVKNGIPLYRNNFILTLQETSVVGYVAIHDLTKASTIVASRTFNALFGLIVITIMYMVIGLFVSDLLNLLRREKHLRPEDVQKMEAAGKRAEKVVARKAAVQQGAGERK